MVQSPVIRRLVIAALFVGAIALIPAGSAYGDDGSSGTESATDASGIVAQAIDWLVDLVTRTTVNEAPNDEGDGGSEFDPSG